jgi:hypothetical protein
MKELDERRIIEGQVGVQLESLADGQDDQHHRYEAQHHQGEVHEHFQEDQNHSKDSNFSEAHGSALDCPILDWTTHGMAPSASELNTCFRSTSSQSSVEATNSQKPDLKIARRAKFAQGGEVHVRVHNQSDHHVQDQVGEGPGANHHQGDVQEEDDHAQAADIQDSAHHHQHEVQVE